MGGAEKEEVVEVYKGCPTGKENFKEFKHWEQEWREELFTLKVVCEQIEEKAKVYPDGNRSVSGDGGWQVGCGGRLTFFFVEL